MKAKDVIINTEGKIGKVTPPEGQRDAVPYVHVADMRVSIPKSRKGKGGKAPRG
jgi:hypothetical protein